MRHDYHNPFRVDPASGQAAQSRYADHVQQMIRQVLLTSPGERIDLPEFGCGLRKMVFAPYSDALAASTQLLVQTSLTRWLGQHISVQKVTVPPPEAAADPGTLVIQIEYTLLETMDAFQTELRLLNP
jgi:phage baseplate assembly protein W